mmetsp:Transcript_14547/g.21917  ORF Transcript_14547/g.21917 Transcript_14547/m.21917 type:complete len:512 (+) Transcript_14547:134-1669(+)
MSSTQVPISAKEKKIRAIAEYKAKKVKKEEEKRQELMKQFPKLFSPEKIKKYHQRNQQHTENNENISENKKNIQIPRKQSSTTKTSIRTHKESSMMKVSSSNTQSVKSPESSIGNESISDDKEEEFHCIFSFENDLLHTKSSISLCTEETSENMCRTSSSNSVYEKRRVSSICPCGRVSCGEKVRKSMTPPRYKDDTTDLYEYTDDILEYEEECDICKSLAPHAAQRNQLMSALRNFIHMKKNQVIQTIHEPSYETTDMKDRHEPSVDSSVQEDSYDISICQSTYEKNIKIISPNVTLKDTQSEMNSSHGISCMSISSPLPTYKEGRYDTSISPSVTLKDTRSDTILNNRVSSRSISSTLSTYKGGFYDVLETGLYDKRVYMEITGRKIRDTYVEYVIHVKVLKPDYDEDICQNESPYIMHMVLFRRYSEFLALFQALSLHRTLQSLVMNFPPKQILPFGNRWAGTEFLDTREALLKSWLQKVFNLKLWETSDSAKHVLVREFSKFLSNEP